MTVARRSAVVMKLCDILGHENKSKNIEISIYNWTIAYVKNNQIQPREPKKLKSKDIVIFDNSLTWENSRFVNVYNSKCRSILFNLKNKNNPQFLERIKSGDIKSKDVASLTHMEIFPSLWDNGRDAQNMNDWSICKCDVKHLSSEKNILVPVLKKGLKNILPTIDI